MASEAMPTAVFSARSKRVEDKVSYLSRWLYAWIALLVVATLTVVAFLIIIAMALSNVDNNIAAAQNSVHAVRSNVSILPGQINTVNSHLQAVNANLNSIPGQVSQVNTSLGSVSDSLQGTRTSLAGTANVLQHTNSSLQSTDKALGGIDSSLRTTTGSLKDTESLLTSVQGLAGHIRGTLVATDRAPNNLDNLPVTAGAAGVYMREAVLNHILNPARSDVDKVLASLVNVNGHLRRICEAPALQLIGVVSPHKLSPTTPC